MYSETSLFILAVYLPGKLFRVNGLHKDQRANSILRNSGEMGGMRGIGGMAGTGGMGGIGGIGGLKFDFFIRQVCKTHVTQVSQVTQVILNQRVFWVKDGLKMEFSGNGCA